MLSARNVLAKEESLECQALISHKLDLVIDIIANHGEELRQILIERRIISHKTSNEPVELVAEIISVVKIWPDRFNLVLQALKEKCEWSQHIVEKLMNKLKFLKGDCHFSSWYSMLSIHVFYIEIIMTANSWSTAMKYPYSNA